jgi:hypothetical protein
MTQFVLMGPDRIFCIVGGGGTGADLAGAGGLDIGAIIGQTPPAVLEEAS